MAGESYTQYITYLNNIANLPVSNINFKREPAYTEILEHVSVDLGSQYLNIIQSDPYNMSDSDVRAYVDYNDRLGNPTRHSYVGKNGTIILASPSSFRYIYHALVILKELVIKKASKIVEVGGGYGGLCLAIHYYAKKLGYNIESYAIIDLPPVNGLISKYINAVEPTIRVSLHDAEKTGKDVIGADLFLISNYCFTEIKEQYRQSYIADLFPKVKDGFLIWQTGLISLEYPIPFSKTIEEEKPQTSAHNKNYFVSISR